MERAVRRDQLHLTALACQACLAFFALAPTAAVAGGDHHMHIYSADGAGAWAAICAALPDDCAEEQPIPTTALTTASAIQALDAAGLEKGAVLSLAYFFGAGELAGSDWDDRRRVRAENEFTAEQVAEYPDRLAGFLSLNPLADYALDETRFWAERGGLAGLKIHLANSDVDLRDPEQLEQLRAIVDVLDAHGMTLLVHLRNLDPDYGYEHAAAFIESVARHAPNVTFQLAHMAGWGGYDAGTDAAVQAFLDAIEDGVMHRDQVWFDLAAVVDGGMEADTYALLEQKLRRIGLDRVLFASDWDETEPAAYIAALRERLQLSNEELLDVLNNEAPYLSAKGAQ